MNWFKKFSLYLKNNVEEVEFCIIPFGYLLVIGYLGFYFFNLLVASPSGYENLSLRVSIALLGVGLILKNYWLSSQKLLMSIYWHITLIYSLSFFFFFMLFHNPESNIWQINGLVGMVTLTFFVDWIAYIALTSIGAILAYIAFCFTNDAPHLSSTLLGVFGSYSAPVIYLILFSYKRKKSYQEKQLVEVKEFNLQLVKQATELQKALNIKTEFLNNISHEVRTPISGVVNISELLLENWRNYSEEERYKNMQKIAQSGNRLLLVMNNILDLSKFTAGKMSIEKSLGNLEQLVREMVVECQTLYIMDKDLTIETNIQSGLNSEIIMDWERITQVLRNLIGNAVKFTDQGVITISLFNQGKYLEIIVDDQGVGIPEGELEEIFFPFVQSSKTKNRSGGTGLGLSICKEIITAHNGKIWAENKPNKGSKFHILIPQIIGTEEYKNIVKSTINKREPKKVALMIDDDEICHNIISMILENEGYRLISAYGGAEGIETLRKHKDEIDFVLLDLMMPDVYGINVLQEIKMDQELSGIPIIIQSASSDAGEIRKALDVGAVNFFKKPYDRKIIVLFIDEILGRKPKE